MTTRRAEYLATGFTEAKAGLSALMDEVVHRHQPKVIDRHHGREQMFAMDVDSMTDIILRDAFTPLEVDFDQDSVVVTATDLSLIGEGPDVPAALEMLAEEIDDFAQSYFERFDYFKHTADVKLAPFLLRFALTAPDDKVPLLLAPLREGTMGKPAAREEAAYA